MTDRGTIQARFTAALDTLVAQVKDDRSVLAAVLCGSLSHDTVWEKSDIDLVLVTVDDKQIERDGVSLTVDDVNIHAMLVSADRVPEDRRGIAAQLVRAFVPGERAAAGTRTIRPLPISATGFATSARATRRSSCCAAGTSALRRIDKAHKWFVTRGDLDYAALWILYAATPLAQIEVIARGLLADREVIPQASAQPRVLQDDLRRPAQSTQDRGAVERRAARDRRLHGRSRAGHLRTGPRHLRDVGEVRSCTEIEEHFKRHFDVSGVTMACEYLADQGLIGKASSPVRLTKRSNVDVQELAFFYVSDPRPTDHRA